MEQWSDNDPNMSTLLMIGNWIDSSPVCQTICDDARAGCEDSEAFINNIMLRMDTARFFMDKKHQDNDRVDKELDSLVRIIEGVNELD